MLKNAFWLFSGQTTGRAIRAIIVIYAARVLGTAGFGVASYALSLTGFFVMVTDMGLSGLLTKYAAQKPDERERYFATLVVAKYACAGASFAIILAFGPLMTKIPEAAALLPLAGLVLIFDSLREFALAMVRAREKMEWEAALAVTTNAATVAFSLVLLLSYPAPWALLTGYALGSGTGLALALWALRNYLKKTFTHFDRTLVGPLSAQALPLALGSLLGGTMLTVDTIMLGFWRTAGEIGLYSAAQKPVQLAYGIAGIANIALFPALSRLYADDNGKFKATVKKTLVWSFIAGGVLAALGAAFPESVMRLIYGGEYAAAAQTFRILCLTLAINAPIILGVSAIIAANKQNAFLWSAPIGALSNAGLNALLIPRWGAEGAAISTLVTQIVMNGYLWIKIRELYK